MQVRRLTFDPTQSLAQHFCTDECSSQHKLWNHPLDLILSSSTD